MSDELQRFIDDASEFASRERIVAVKSDLNETNAELLAAELVKREILSPFQSDRLLAGRKHELTLGNYSLLDQIGRGGMGAVFKAQHRRMKRIVALKILSPEITAKPAGVKRFQREVETAAKLIHPNIVTAFDADQAGDTHYLVMEFVEGIDLAKHISAYGPLSCDQAIDFTIQAARGLAFAHEQGIVHRDIKPANLLLDANGVVKILDLGLASIQSNVAAEESELTKSGNVMGTVDYMAPEQAIDTRSADARADVYSLGCSLYRFLTGMNVYEGETLVEKLMAHQNKPIPSLRASREDVPRRLDAIFQRMVAKRVEDRYSSMREVIAVLSELAGPAGEAPTESALTSQSILFGERRIGSNRDDSTVDLISNGARHEASRAGRRIALFAAVIGATIGFIWLATRERKTNELPLDGRVETRSEPNGIEPPSDPLRERLTSDSYRWSKPENLGPGVNTSQRELKASLTADELTLLFTRETDLWIAERTSLDEPFGNAVRLPDSINLRERAELQGSLSGDGLLMAFVSDRPGSEKEDVWLAERSSRSQPFGEPKRIESANTAGTERGAVLSEDGLTLLFNSDTGDRTANADLYLASRSSRAEPFGERRRLPEPASGPKWDVPSWLSHDLRFLVYSVPEGTTNRIHILFRERTEEPFRKVGDLGPPLNEIANSQPVLSHDGERAYFHSRAFTNDGNLDLWMVRRVNK